MQDVVSFRLHSPCNHACFCPYCSLFAKRCALQQHVESHASGSTRLEESYGGFCSEGQLGGVEFRNRVSLCPAFSFGVVFGRMNMGSSWGSVFTKFWGIQSGSRMSETLHMLHCSLFCSCDYDKDCYHCSYRELLPEFQPLSCNLNQR